MAKFPFPISVSTPVFLAPLSGITDVPFRKLAAYFGVDYVVSEMVASSEYLKERKDCVQRALSAGITPHIVQLAGREPYWMGEGARLACANGADVIDINMGCPAKQVTAGASGSALMRDLPLAQEIIKAIVKGADKPVSLKMRLGWDDNSLNADELAKIAYNEGIAWLTIHGRTRCQFYKGQADWEKVKKVTKSTPLPTLVNGDILSLEDAKAALKQSGADGVMIGRGACGKPWIVKQIQNDLNDISNDYQQYEPAEFILCHYEDMLEFYGVNLGVRNARKHLGWFLETYYMKNENALTIYRKKLLSENDPQKVRLYISEIFSLENLKLAA